MFNDMEHGERMIIPAAVVDYRHCTVILYVVLSVDSDEWMIKMWIWGLNVNWYIKNSGLSTLKCSIDFFLYFLILFTEYEMTFCSLTYFFDLLFGFIFSHDDDNILLYVLIHFYCSHLHYLLLLPIALHEGMGYSGSFIFPNCRNFFFINFVILS